MIRDAAHRACTPAHREPPSNQESTSLDSAVINDGTASRSQISSWTVTFDSEVDHASLQAAFTVMNTDTETEVGVIGVSSTNSGGKTISVLTFSDHSTVVRLGTSDAGNPLTDGNDRLDIDARQVKPSSDVAMASKHRFGNQLAAEEDNDEFFRLLGDANGDGVRNGIDLNAIIPSLFNPAGYREDLDTNGDGVINGIDLNGLIPTIFGAGRE